MNNLQHILNGVAITTKNLINVPVQSICVDSRHVLPGTAFVAIPGTTTNGSNYISEAIHRGAAVIISPDAASRKDYEPKTPIVKVKNPRRALSQIAANFFEHPSRELTIIGITGTNGKTTTSHLLYSILQANGIKAGIIGTLGAKADRLEAKTVLTTPGSIDLHRILRLFVNGGITHVVMEVSSHALEQKRVSDVEFDMAVFTNLSQDHLDYHHTMENYLSAKTKLFSMLQKSGAAIINSRSEYSGTVKNHSAAPVISYQVEGDADIRFKSWGMSINGIKGVIQADKSFININSALIGIHNLENIVSAVSTAWALGIPTENIEKGITDCNNVPGRMERFVTNNGASVFIDYAHTPDAYYKLFSSLKMLLHDDGELWVIFGCGGDRDHDKRPLMATAAELYTEHVFVTPDNPRTESIENINSDIAAGFTKDTHTFYNNRGNAIKDAISQMHSNDILAIVGKGRENYQIIGSEKVYYSDVEIIERTINEN